MPRKITFNPVQWNDMGVQPPITVNEFRGVNTLDKFSIEQGFSPKAENWTGGAYPTLSTRPGYSQLGGTFASMVQGIGIWKDQQIHIVAGGSWVRWNGSAWEWIYNGLSASNSWSFTNFQGNLSSMSLIGVDGSAALYYNGSTVQPLANVPAGAKYVDTHDNRLYVAIGQKVVNSALRKPQDWTTLDDAGEIVIETPDGSDITALKAGAQHLTIFKDGSMHELFGNSPASYYRRPVADDIGCVGNNAVTIAEGSMFFVDRKNLYEYGGARPRSDFAIPVKSYMEQLNQANRSKAVAGSTDRKLYFSIPVGAETEPYTTLEYDINFQIWNVWRTPITPRAYARMGNQLFSGNIGGNTVTQLGGTTDLGNPIYATWESPPIGSGVNMAMKVQWYRMWYVADVPGGSTLTIYVNRNAEGTGGWVQVQNVSPVGLQSGRVIIPITTLANSNWARVRFDATGPVTIREFDYQERALPMY